MIALEKKRDEKEKERKREGEGKKKGSDVSGCGKVPRIIRGCIRGDMPRWKSAAYNKRVYTRRHVKVEKCRV